MARVVNLLLDEDLEHSEKVSNQVTAGSKTMLFLSYTAGDETYVDIQVTVIPTNDDSDIGSTFFPLALFKDAGVNPGDPTTVRMDSDYTELAIPLNFEVANSFIRLSFVASGGTPDGTLSAWIKE